MEESPTRARAPPPAPPRRSQPQVALPPTERPEPSADSPIPEEPIAEPSPPDSPVAEEDDSEAGPLTASPSKAQLLGPTKSLRDMAKDTEKQRASGQGWMFLAICFLQVLANFDNGVLPSVLGAIQSEYNLDFSQLGLLGALVYVGLVASCPISGYLLTQCGSPRLVLVGSVALNAGALFLFAAAPEPVYLLVARALIGLSQAPIFIYAPVWVDDFAPPQRMTLWISLLQANVAIGIMLGYVFGGSIVASAGAAAWRIPLYVQAALIAPFAILYLFIPDVYVSTVGGLEARIRKIEHELEESGMWALETDYTALAASAAMGAHGTIPEAVRESEEEEEEDVDDEDVAVEEAQGSEEVAQGSEKAESEEPAPAEAANEDEETEEATASAKATDDDEVTEEAAVSASKGAGLVPRSGDGDEDDDDDEISLCEGTLSLLVNSVFMLLSIGLTGLYFVVTGIQFWITDYLVRDIGSDPAAVVAGFAITSLTAPTAGVFFGGWLIDRMGGYKDDSGQSAFVTLRVCCLFGLGAVAAAIPAAVVREFGGIMASVWLVLFFGGALLPAVTGVAISSVPPPLRSVANALSLLLYNLLGYALAPVLCGVIASAVGIAWGFRVVMIASSVALIPIVIASIVAKPQKPPEAELIPKEEEEEEELPAPAEPATAPGRSRRGTMTDAVMSVLAGAIGVPDPGPYELTHQHRRRTLTAGRIELPAVPEEASSAVAPRRPVPPPPKSPTPPPPPRRGRGPSEGSDMSSPRARGSSGTGRRLSALHGMGLSAMPAPPSRAPRARGESASAAAPVKARRPTGVFGAEGVPLSKANKERRVSGMVSVLGDISMHASRGRALTSFFTIRHVFDDVAEETNEEEEDEPEV
jgi:MFS family permease